MIFNKMVHFFTEVFKDQTHAQTNTLTHKHTETPIHTHKQPQTHF